jgi:large subunit ribosomal protein L24
MAGLNIRKGDQVLVIAGKDRGKQGRVVRTWPKGDKLMIEGVNQVKRHEPLRQARSGRQGMEGGIITKEMPVHISTVTLVCNTPDCGGRARVGVKIIDDPSLPLKRRKQRVCSKCGVEL